MANQICVNDILDGISIKLNEIFGDEYTIYTNKVKQGFEMPCFYIKQFQDTRTKKVGNRYYNTTSFIIHVFLENPTIEELNDIGHQLYELEYIELLNKDVLRGSDMRTQIIDDVLQFFIDYNFFTFKETKKEDAMESIEITEEVKHD